MRSFLNFTVVAVLLIICFSVFTREVLAGSFVDDLLNFIRNRQPTLEEKFPDVVLTFFVYKKWQEKPDAIVIPLYTAQVFAKELFRQRKFAELEEFCHAALKMHFDPFLCLMLAEEYEITGQIDQAIEFYRKLPSEPVANFMLWGIYQYDKIDPKMAQYHLQRFKNTLPKNEKHASVIKENLALNLMDFGNFFLNEKHLFNKAKRYFTMVFEIGPNGNYEKAKLNSILCDLNKSGESKDIEGLKKAYRELKNFAQATSDKEAALFAHEVIKKINSLFNSSVPE